MEPSDPRHESEDESARLALFEMQSRRHAFRYRCDHCLHLLDAGVCTLRHPVQELRDPRTPVLREGRWIFCKDFELA